MRIVTFSLAAVAALSACAKDRGTLGVRTPRDPLSA